ncbi:hypothetical protein EMCRGX_G016398 [Ephydatia muelleri]
MATYGLSISNNAIQLNNIEMSELGHDSCFLQKFDLSIWLGYCRIESLDGNFTPSFGAIPYSYLDPTKLTTSKHFGYTREFILKQDISILSTSTQHGLCHLKLMNIALVVSSESGARGVDMQTIFKGCI